MGLTQRGERGVPAQADAAPGLEVQGVDVTFGLRLEQTTTVDQANTCASLSLTAV